MNYQQRVIAESVLSHGNKIKMTANNFGVSPSTVRRYMDLYTDEMLLETLENAYLVHIEMHVGNDTRHLTQTIYARSKEEAVKKMNELKPDYRGNENPAYELQVKGGPFKLTENHRMMKEY